jgi:hypothetical protein
MVALLRQEPVVRRRVVVAKKLAKEAGAVVVHGAFVLTEKQYDHFEQCMKTPEPPTKAMLESHRQLRQFVAKNPA